MTDGRKIIVDFIDEGGTTRIVETFNPEMENPCDIQQVGWQAILDNYAPCVARTETVISLLR